MNLVQGTGGRGFRTLINTALRDVMRGKEIADDLRRVLREELRAS